MRQVIFCTAASDEIRRKVCEDGCLSVTSPDARTGDSTTQNANAAWSQCHGLDAGNTPIHRPHRAAQTLASDSLARHASPCFGVGTFGGNSTEFSFRVTSLRHLVTLTFSLRSAYRGTWLPTADITCASRWQGCALRCGAEFHACPIPLSGAWNAKLGAYPCHVAGGDAEILGHPQHGLGPHQFIQLLSRDGTTGLQRSGCLSWLCIGLKRFVSHVVALLGT